MKRRSLLCASLCCGALAAAAQSEDAALALRQGGAVLALRHALAPGTFDPENFKLGDCSTQRNLNDEGRAQARRLASWMAARQLRPARVRSSPWCRCVDTARMAFADTELWPALGSPRGQSEAARLAQGAELRHALRAASAKRGEFEVWVTHMFVLAELVQVPVASSEGLVLRADANGNPQLWARLGPF